MADPTIPELNQAVSVDPISIMNIQLSAKEYFEDKLSQIEIQSDTITQERIAWLEEAAAAAQQKI